MLAKKWACTKSKLGIQNLIFKRSRVHLHNTYSNISKNKKSVYRMIKSYRVAILGRPRVHTYKYP